MFSSKPPRDKTIALEPAGESKRIVITETGVKLFVIVVSTLSICFVLFAMGVWILRQ